MLGFVKVGFEVGFNPAKNRKTEHPCRQSSTSILHGLNCRAVSPPPPHNSRSCASTTVPCTSPAVVVLRLCCGIRPPPLPPHICWLLIFIIVASIVVAPPPPIVVACLLLHLPRHFSRRCPPPHPTVVACLPLNMLHISWLLLAVGGGAVVAPLPPLLPVHCHLSCRLQGCRIMYENKHAGLLIYQGIFFESYLKISLIISTTLEVGFGVGFEW